MNSIMTSAFALLSVAGLFGVVSQEPQKTKDECCAKKADDCCSSKAEKCCEKMKDECCAGTPVQDGKRTSGKQHCVPEKASDKTDRPANSHCAPMEKHAEHHGSCGHGGHPMEGGPKVGDCASCVR